MKAFGGGIGAGLGWEYDILAFGELALKGNERDTQIAQV